MNDNQLDDLKQFIDSRISQAESRLDGRIGELDGKIGELDRRISGLQTEMNQRFDDLQAAIADTITATNNSADEQLKNHELRILKLEQQRT